MKWRTPCDAGVDRRERRRRGVFCENRRFGNFFVLMMIRSSVMLPQFKR